MNIDVILWYKLTSDWVFSIKPLNLTMQVIVTIFIASRGIPKVVIDRMKGIYPVMASSNDCAKTDWSYKYEPSNSDSMV